MLGRHSSVQRSEYASRPQSTIFLQSPGIDLSGFASQFANQNSLAAIRFSFFIAQNCDALQRPVVCGLHATVVHTAD